MTQPGYVHPPAPGWWVRTDRIGVTSTHHEWSVSAAATLHPVGQGAGTYGWAGSATGISHVVYSATGVGNFSATGQPTWTHTASANDYIVVGIAAYSTGAFTAVTYGGSAMTFLGYKYSADYDGYGFVAAYGFLDTVGGVNTIATTRTGTNAAYGNSVSYKGVKSARCIATSLNLNATPSQPVEMPYADSMAVQMFASLYSDDPIRWNESCQWWKHQRFPDHQRRRLRDDILRDNVQLCLGRHITDPHPGPGKHHLVC